MGNKNSRVAPAKSLKIFDAQTRTRYKNQRETNRLRLKMQDLQVQHYDQLSRLAFNQQDVKMQLHELHYDKSQRDLYKSFDQDGRKKQPRLSKVHLGKDPYEESSSLLLHNLYESRRQQRSNTPASKPIKLEDSVKPLSAYENFRLQYASKVDVSSEQMGRTEETMVTHTRSLQKETELMKKSIKIAVAKSRRDSHMMARRDTLVY